MKTTWRIYIIVLVFGINLLNARAQINYEQTRSSDTITYYLINSYGNNAVFTWTVTGGEIAGHLSPYTAAGADTIQVIWSDSNKTTANYGSLSVSEVVNWPSGASCPGDEEQINIESWVQPKASTDTAGIIVCTGEPFVITVNFEGKPEYKYKWKLYDKENPEIIVEDYTSDFINCANPSTDIVFDGMENADSTEKIYVFEVTDVQDGLDDGMPGNVSMGRVKIYVQPKKPAGALKSNNHLIRR